MWMVVCLFLGQGALNDAAIKQAEVLRENALASNRAFEILESLTVEVGPRMAGSENDARAVAWAKAKFEELGFDRVWTEDVTFPAWFRGEATCEIVTPFPQPLQVTALGTSVGTDPDGITAEVIEFPDLDAVKAAKAADVKGKIVFINGQMERSKTGRGYGKAVVVRKSGASEAAKKGALAVLIRSIGTDSHRFPHTGLQQYDDGVQQIPAAALSNPDANQLHLALQRGPLQVRLSMSCRLGEPFTSQNVIGEIRGREKPDECVLIGGHLDSWDLGTGAVDDGAGVAITMEAARLISSLPQRPRRSIRVVLFANEEQGLWGGKAYASAHREELSQHVIAAESDFGAGLVWAFATRVDEAALPTMEQIAEVLKPLGIEPAGNEAYGGPDIGPMMKLGMPAASLYQDGSDYFDVHHTADDTLDKVDPSALTQNVAAYVVFVFLTAEAPISFAGN